MVPVTSLAFTHSARIAFGIKTALKRASRLRGEGCSDEASHGLDESGALSFFPSGAENRGILMVFAGWLKIGDG